MVLQVDWKKERMGSASSATDSSLDKLTGDALFGHSDSINEAANTGQNEIYHNSSNVAITQMVLILIPH